MTTLAKFLRDARKASGLTQQDLSMILGYQTSQFVSNWERGISAPPLKDIPKLIKKFQLPRGTFRDLYLARLRRTMAAQYQVKERKLRKILGGRA